jgi:hypothetical protein
MKAWQVTQGIAGGPWVVVVRDGSGAVYTGFSGVEALAGIIWSGDTKASLATFTPVWQDAATGKVVATIAKTTTAALAPGVYLVEIHVADGSAALFRGQLEVLASAGSGSAPFSYVTFDQMLEFAPRAGRLFDTGSDETGFAEQRAQASLGFDRRVLLRYNPQPGRSRRYVSDDGTAAGPYLRYALGPGGVAAPTRAAIAGYLGTSAVIVNADVKESVARDALANIYDGEPGGGNPYREDAQRERTLAAQAFRRALVEFDTNADGVAEVRVDQDATWLS